MLEAHTMIWDCYKIQDSLLCDQSLLIPDREPYQAKYDYCLSLTGWTNALTVVSYRSVGIWLLLRPGTTQATVIKIPSKHGTHKKLEPFKCLWSWYAAPWFRSVLTLGTFTGFIILQKVDLILLKFLSYSSGFKKLPFQNATSVMELISRMECFSFGEIATQLLTPFFFPSASGSSSSI